MGGVMQRANEFAKGNKIKRTGTFHQKVREERAKSLEDNTVIEETNTMLAAEAGTGTDTYVPSKLDKVASTSASLNEDEQQMAGHIELAEQPKDTELVPQPRSEEEPLSTHAEDEQAGNDEDEQAQHGYTETMVVKQDAGGSSEEADDVPLTGKDEAANVAAVREDSP